jgi:DNA invertase Pin-like site-specific DNA recombinase
MLDYVREGDTVVCTKLDRLARSVTHLWEIVGKLQATGVALRIEAMGIDTNTPTGKLMLNVLGGVAQFEREIMLERQREGIAKAKGLGKYQGRKPTARAKSQEVEALKAAGLSMGAIGKRLGISKASVSRILSRTERSAGGAGGEA